MPRPVCVPRSVAVSFWRTAAEREPGLKQNQVLPFKGLSMLLSFFFSFEACRELGVNSGSVTCVRMFLAGSGLLSVAKCLEHP